MNRTLPSILLSLILTACGGGGGTTPSVPVAPVVISLPAILYDTSYKNFKSYPIDTFGIQRDGANYGFGSFLKAGEVSIFHAHINAAPFGTSAAAIMADPQYVSDFEFWSIDSNNRQTKVLSFKGCVGPRKAVVADFNHDGIPDVFVACTGPDIAPFPGEKSKLLLSNGYGRFTMTEVTDVGFFHSAASADINNDGYPDIVVSDSRVTPAVYALINQRDGTFSTDHTLITGAVSNSYFTVELIDLNGDNKVDLVVGGHEFSGAATTILYNDGTGHFGATQQLIPSVAGSGVVSDFTYVENNGKKQLFIDRPYDPSNSSGFYGGWSLQVFDLSTNRSNVIVSTPTDSVIWWVPKTVNGQHGVVAFTGGTFYTLP